MRALETLTVSVLARVEVSSAIWRKARKGELSNEHARALARAFRYDFHGSAETTARFAVIEASAAIADSAARLCDLDGLRAYDALQLATLEDVSQEVAVDAFACFDDELRAAAGRHGFALLPA